MEGEGVRGGYLSLSLHHAWALKSQTCNSEARWVRREKPMRRKPETESAGNQKKPLADFQGVRYLKGSILCSQWQCYLFLEEGTGPSCRLEDGGGWPILIGGNKL